MTTQHVLLVFLVGFSCAAACKPSSDKSTALKVQPTSGQLSNVATATTSSVDPSSAVSDYTFAQKDAFVADMRAKLVVLNRSIDEVETKLAATTEAAKADSKPKLTALREQASHLDWQLNQVASANEKTWGGIKTETQKSFEAFKAAVAGSLQWTGVKMTP